MIRSTLDIGPSPTVQALATLKSGLLTVEDGKFADYFVSWLRTYPDLQEGSFIWRGLRHKLNKFVNGLTSLYLEIQNRIKSRQYNDVMDSLVVDSLEYTSISEDSPSQIAEGIQAALGSEGLPFFSSATAELIYDTILQNGRNLKPAAQTHNRGTSSMQWKNDYKVDYPAALNDPELFPIIQRKIDARVKLMNRGKRGSQEEINWIKNNLGRVVGRLNSQNIADAWATFSDEIKIDHIADREAAGRQLREVVAIVKADPRLSSLMPLIAEGELLLSKIPSYSGDVYRYDNPYWEALVKSATDPAIWANVVAGNLPGVLQQLVLNTARSVMTDEDPEVAHVIGQLAAKSGSPSAAALALENKIKDQLMVLHILIRIKNNGLDNTPIVELLKAYDTLYDEDGELRVEHQYLLPIAGTIGSLAKTGKKLGKVFKGLFGKKKKKKKKKEKACRAAEAAAAAEAEAAARAQLQARSTATPPIATVTAPVEQPTGISSSSEVPGGGMFGNFPSYTAVNRVSRARPPYDDEVGYDDYGAYVDDEQAQSAYNPYLEAEGVGDGRSFEYYEDSVEDGLEDNLVNSTCDSEVTDNPLSAFK